MTRKRFEMRKTIYSARSRVLAFATYRLVFPALTAYLLLVLPSATPRSLLSDSLVIDWIARFVLTLYFCVQYWYLPALYEPKPGKWIWISDFVLHNPHLLRGYYVLTAIGYAFFAALFTYLAFSAFLPGLGSWRIMAACANALSFLFAFGFRYGAFKEVAAAQLHQ